MSDFPLVDLMSPEAARSHLMIRQALPVEAIPTPFPSWNRHCRDDGGQVGLAYGWHVALGAATGTGKSLLAANMGATAIAHGEPVGFVSLEMSQAQLHTRIAAILTGEPVYKLERGEAYCERTARRATRRIEELREEHGAGFYTNRLPLRRIEDVADVIRYFAQEYGCRLVLVDYLQLIASDAEQIRTQVANASGIVRRLAVDLNIVTVGLTQLNRVASANRTEPPTVQHFLGGSPIENDADQALVVDHSRVKRAPSTTRSWLLLDKNRHGSVGDIAWEFDRSTLRVREAEDWEKEKWTDEDGWSS